MHICYQLPQMGDRNLHLFPELPQVFLHVLKCCAYLRPGNYCCLRSTESKAYSTVNILGISGFLAVECYSFCVSCCLIGLCCIS